MTVRWSRLLHLRASESTSAAAPGALVVAERHSRLVRLNPGTGTPLWEQGVEDCWGTSVIAGERCLYLSQAGVLNCFDMHSGQRSWSTPNLSLHRYLSVSGSIAFLGGWRGYRPLIRVDLDNGEPLPGQFPKLAAGSSLAWPLPVRSGLERSPADAVLIATANEAALLLLDARTGAARSEWALPEPVCFPDSGLAFNVDDDGRVVFLSGRRTVMALSPGSGVEVLWQHDRDLPPLPPILTGRTLWLAEDTGVTIIDLDRGARTEVVDLPHGATCGGVPVPGGALFARSGNHLVVLTPGGVIAARMRLPAPTDRLLSDGRTLVHAMGKGHLTTLDISTKLTRSLVADGIWPRPTQ
ncbi:PQQ-binding-like beta-propeller repeat protein [Micromonospora sp. WMMD967]|uniref:outer membrane protein assembly factor BamB family protein n=1 Tax=Micromonospora sp. WMMD967 TaxID=3016101 RepID=UPI0024165535|nr:PQQ-binding-like beta-propeller repeat protein [Micromonospora sp. WMMD967]MDG4838516.1 PQQ-binding-like beta-propeller repeat protein [Micromonospora sp. WMMD967]